MRPVFEYALVETLGSAEVGAAIFRDPAPQDVVVTAFDDIDGINLHVAEVLHRRSYRLCSPAERRGGIEPLGA